jgi:hypothetical protein
MRHKPVALALAGPGNGQGAGTGQMSCCVNNAEDTLFAEQATNAPILCVNEFNEPSDRSAKHGVEGSSLTDGAGATRRIKHANPPAQSQAGLSKP